MTTSGVTAWTVTVENILEKALIHELGVYGFGEGIPADAASFAISHLNDLLKSASDGAHLETQGTVTIPAASASGNVTGNIGEVISARIGATNERPLVRFGRDEYLALPNKAAVGEPTCFYVSNQRDASTMYVWPVPAAETIIKIDYRRIPETVLVVSETIDFPLKYHPALSANLAVRCSGRLGISPNDRPELFARADKLWREMQDDERPHSYQLGAY